MNKVRMTQKEFDQVQELKKHATSLLCCLNDFINSADVYQTLNQLKVGAAYLGAGHCEIEPEYEELDHVQAAMAYAKAENVWFQMLDGSEAWKELNSTYSPAIFQDEQRKFRRQKP